MHVLPKTVACVAADSFPFSGGAEIKQASEKRASEGARLGWRAFGRKKETVVTQATKTEIYLDIGRFYARDVNVVSDVKAVSRRL